MPAITKYATTGQAAGGVFNGSWTSPANVASDNGVYATAAPGKNQEYASVFGIAFSTTDIPNGSTIDSALVEIQVKCSTTSSIGIVTSSLFADSAQATAIGAVPGVQSPATEPTVDTTYSFTRNPTLAEVRDLWVRVQGTRGNSNTALTWSLDFVRVTVNYTAPPPGVTGTGAATSAASTGTGSGKEAFRATGAATAALSAGSGAGVQRFSGSGAGVAATSTSSGTATVTLAGSTGTGAGASATSTGDGAGVLSYIASGAATSQASTADGQGALIFTAAGAGISAASSSTALGLLRFIAEGAAISAASSGSGSGTYGVIEGTTGTGAGASALSTGYGRGMTGEPEHGPWLRHGEWHFGRKPHH